MGAAVNVLDVVALTEDLPERSLYRGQVGTVVESLAPDVFEVEFSDNEGRTYASLALKVEQLLVMHHEPVETACPTRYRRTRGARPRSTFPGSTQPPGITTDRPHSYCNRASSGSYALDSANSRIG
jgi:hypothetical protein